MDSNTCWVDNPPAQRIYRPYIWDGCPGFDSSSSDWGMRYGLYTSTTTTTEQHDVEPGAVATCIELGGGKTMTSQPADSKSGFEEAGTLPLSGKSHIVEGVGALGGIGAAAVLGFGFMRGKKRQAKKNKGGEELEMGGGANAV
ncbi:hypothetical protein TL16_g00699 [Triparma laevis f. inornata]|uniref:Uncharacterized protein n=1 Tax=Triparma laevis f. inornata TaxID=1714386 RepID=A0A9W6Z8V2_9STRA|nr:hypothetical protein TL16_g00699 [Triparma laevis f. inornata]